MRSGNPMSSGPLPLAMTQSQPAPVALVVEDGSIFRMEAVGLLEDAGYVVLEAADAAGALRHLEGDTPVAVLLTDVRMPGPMDGFALAREVERRWPAIASL